MATLECRLINASIACYAIKNGALDPANPNLAKLGLKPGTQPTVFVNGPEHINAGFVAETADDWVVLALRGTLPPFKGDLWAWIRDWLQDFEAGPTDWTIGGRVFGRVETGFATGMLSIWPMAKAAIDAIDLTGKRGILVTGHSKGAAMTFLATSLIKSEHPHMLVQNCCFAAPLTCDATFQSNYDALGLRPFTVRYQNEYDIVPFLPWWPALTLAASAERRERGEAVQMAPEAWPEPGNAASDNLYKPVGILRYIGPSCQIEYGTKAENDAWTALWQAIDAGKVREIAEAHSASGRYCTCIC